jgi:hypothetical protein
MSGGLVQTFPRVDVYGERRLFVAPVEPYVEDATATACPE